MPPSLLCAIFLVLLYAAAPVQAAEEALDGPDSPYTGRFARMLRQWTSKPLVPAPAPRGLEVTCISTPDQDAYVGILRRTAILAPLAAVEDVLDDVAHYKDLFPGLVDVRVVSGSRLGNRFATAWEQRIPVFFLPNITYELSHTVDKSTPGLGLYRYKLRRSDHLIASDGIVVLEAAGPTTTNFTEYGFFHPRSGPVPTAVVWRESVRGAFLSNMAIKLKAENPQWSYERIATEGQRLLASQAERIDRCVAERRESTLRDGAVPAEGASR